MFVFYNANPDAARVGDCTIRAISAATGQTWEETYVGTALEGFILRDMPSANHVWGAYLRRKGFNRCPLPDDCPDCYTVSDFARDHPRGIYILALNGHVVCVTDGNLLDTWDSSNEVVLYYWERGNG